MSLDRRRRGFAGALALLLVLALALLAAGCGGDSGSVDSTAPGGGGELGGATSVAEAEEFGAEASGAQAQGPEAALRGYLDARAKGDGETACSYMSEELRELYARLYKQGGCAEFVERSTGRLSANERAALPEVEVETVRVEGDDGFVIYADAEGSQQAKPVEREGRAWKVSSQLVEVLERTQR